jgi:hypothetical protein
MIDNVTAVYSEVCETTPRSPASYDVARPARATRRRLSADDGFVEFRRDELFGLTRRGIDLLHAMVQIRVQRQDNIAVGAALHDAANVCGVSGEELAPQCPSSR